MGKLKYLGAKITWTPEPLTTAKVYCFSNIKGGVGKSTSVQAFCEALSHAGHEVLAVDLDIQSNLSSAAEAEMPDDAVSMRTLFDYAATKGEIDRKLVYKAIGTTNGGYDIMRCDMDMMVADQVYGGEPKYLLLLKQILETVKDRYHYIVLDTQPNLYYLTISAYCAADEILIPSEANSSSIEGLDFVKYMYEQVRNSYNNKLIIRGLFYTKVKDSATQRNVMKEMEQLSADIKIPILKTYIVDSRLYEALKYKRESLMPNLILKQQLSHYLILTNEITQKPIYKLMAKDTP